ncbi:MAG TPA: LysM peptidoglycan-binding domain-containing protein [Acidimicrobiales bacterium]|nr:LysM peptidoglycan-binding domain-containing protein [Acidimicrobiales bacterium]
MGTTAWDDDEAQVLGGWEGQRAPVILLRPSPVSGRGLNSGAAPARLAAVRGRRPRTFFWRRALVACGIALLGTAAWAAGECLFASTHLAGSVGPASTPGLADRLALASVEGPMGSPGARGVVAAGGGGQRPGWAACAGGGAGRAQPAPSRQCPMLYIARPGDTIWDIAVRYSRGADPRTLTDALEAEIGGGVLQPGQVLSIP